MKTRRQLFLLLILFQLQSSIAQKSQTALPKVENHLNGDLDYTYEALNLVQMQANGEEISLGKITTDGTVHFNLPEFDIKALYDSVPLQHFDFHQWFSIDSGCKDRDVFAETAFDDVYSQKTNAIWIKKYGTNVSILETESKKKIVGNKDATRDSLAIINEYFWFYIDRAITYKENCSKVSHSTGDIDHTIGVDIEFQKGWNFIEENTTVTLDDGQSDLNTSQVRKTRFSKSSPTSKNVKWTLRQVVDDGKIQMAKSLHKLTPIRKEQFEKWVPNKLGDLSIRTKEHGNLSHGRKNKNNMHLIYATETQQKEIDLYIIDCAKSPDDLEMVDFAYAMENDGKDEKDIKPYVTQYNESELATQLLYKIENRIVVNASATNMNGEELWAYIQKLNVEKLLK